MNDRDTRPPADVPPRSSAQEDASPFAFSGGEQAAITRILRDFPEAVQALEVSLRVLLERVAPWCRGLIRSEDDVDYVLTGLADRVVGRTISEPEGEGGMGEELRTAAIDLLTRHLLARARDGFVREVLEVLIEEVPE
jgi:hypothetical protein